MMIRMNRQVLKMTLVLIIAFIVRGIMSGQAPGPQPGFEDRIKDYIDSLRVFDTHEHLYDPVLTNKSGIVDFTVLLLENGFNDLVSSGMPDSLFEYIYDNKVSPSAKWSVIEPYWENASNTASNKIIMTAIRDLYGINDLNASTVIELSKRMKASYNYPWFDDVIINKCRIDYVIQDVDVLYHKPPYARYTNRFCDWLYINSKKTIDSLAIMQVEPIFTLEGFTKSLTTSFKEAMKDGMILIKINLAYQRSLFFEDVSTERARKVFKTLISGNENLMLPDADAKPLQDYMVHHLMTLARQYHVPVAFHTGLQAGNGNIIANSDPLLLVNLFTKYPDVKFVLFHGSYPYGGEVSTLAKNFSNVYIDMNWVYAISPSYSTRYLNEWLETVPANKLMAFGGDQRFVELTYGSLQMAKKVIAGVLTEKVRDNYFTENEAKKIASKLFYDNAKKFYNLK